MELKRIIELYPLGFALWVLLLFIVLIILTSNVYSELASKTYKKILYPTYEQKGKKNPFAKVGKKSANKKRKGIFHKINQKYNVDEKIQTWYNRAGKYDLRPRDFFIKNIQFIFMGAMFGYVGYMFFSSPVIYLFALLFASLHTIEVFSSIMERQDDFKKQFPFFLKTLSFVLMNGVNLGLAIQETVKKTKKGILKEIMEDVILLQKTNGGDYIAAFEGMLEKIDIDESREFVELVRNSHEKGTPIAEVLMIQSDLFNDFLKDKKDKLVNNVENKMIMPLLMVFGAVVMFVFAGLSM